MASPRSKEEIEAEISLAEGTMAQASFWSDKVGAQEIVSRYQELKEELMGVGKYDKGPAILTVLAGAGGDDAEDFAAMLVHMYEKYCEGRGWGMLRLHQNQNEQGGYRNITFEIDAKSAYGTLRNESGVHRLVRISPFNANAKRHTAFAMVEVMPKLPDSTGVDLDESDLRVEHSKSSGPGGQNVNKRETAIRLVHEPTGIAVACDSERTQEANHRRALDILRGKLFKQQEDARKKEATGLSVSKTTSIEWGNQIRSYVLHPYKMVKDHRTDVEVRDPEAVLDRGEIDEFIEAEASL